MKKWPYYYDEQLKKYILQFMSIFAGMQVEIQKPKSEEKVLIPVTIHQGSKDRVSAAILADNTQNKTLRLPAMSAHLTNIEMAPELRKGKNMTRTSTILPQGGLIPDDMQSVKQKMPNPYKAFMELTVYASNQQQMHQIIEQILMIFDPDVEIQLNDNALDWTRLTTVELIGPRSEENYPSSTERRMLVYSFDFQIPIQLSLPAEVKKDIIQSIQMRIGAIDFDDNTADEIIAQLNEDNPDYINIQHVLNLDL